MLSSWPAAADRTLLEAVRALPAVPPSLEGAAARIVERAELHGLADVVFDAWRGGGARVDEVVERTLAPRRMAREIDHDAHLAMVRRIDSAFTSRGLSGVLLKGALFAERYYPRPAARGTTDIDLLVREADLDRAIEALATVGYRASSEPSEARFRREHHHLHLAHEHALPLELHFHAYRGFGQILRSEPLVARSVAAPPLGALRVLSPEDELVYLAVHAAAHRFGRLSWLYDIKLLVATMTDAQVEVAADRARAAGFERSVALAARLLVRGLGVSRGRLAPLLRLGRLRASIAAKLAPEPDRPLVRSATRFAYTVTLCDSPLAAARYVGQASLGHARRWLGLDP